MANSTAMVEIETDVGHRDLAYANAKVESSGEASARASSIGEVFNKSQTVNGWDIDFSH
jgi:hypothetical protein